MIPPLILQDVPVNMVPYDGSGVCPTESMAVVYVQMKNGIRGLCSPAMGVDWREIASYQVIPVPDFVPKMIYVAWERHRQ